MATSTGKKRSASQPPRPFEGKRGWTLRSVGDLKILEAGALTKFDWLVHGFSARPGGSSELESRANSAGPERVLNLGFTDWDPRERVIENRQKLAGALGAEQMRMVTLRQIHSDIAHYVDASYFSSDAEPRQGDALFTQTPGLLLAVQTADCVPILLVDTRLRTVAAIHSGWRGTLQRIAEKALGRMRMEFGTRPQDVIAALGPGIGGCCYEVGHEVAKEFAAQFERGRDWFDGPFDSIAGAHNDPNWLPWLTMAPPGRAPEPPRVHLDLIGANRAILASAGVPPKNILDSGFCTACRTDLFFSYRRERTTGRLMAATAIRSI